MSLKRFQLISLNSEETQNRNYLIANNGVGLLASILSYHQLLNHNVTIVFKVLNEPFIILPSRALWRPPKKIYLHLFMAGPQQELEPVI